MATEKRLIFLDEALDATHKEVFWTESEQAAVRSFLVKRPKVDAVEVVHGRWISPTKINGRSFNIFHCSVCNGVPPGVSEHTKYCSHCGAKMDGDMNG